MKASEARQQWSRLLNQVARRETRVLVEKSGVPVAAIISADDLARLNELEAERQQRLDAALNRMRAAFADVPEDQLERDVADVIAHVRREQRDRTSAQQPA